MSENLSLKLEKLNALEKKYELIKGLPHIYGHKLYLWQKQFIDSTNKNCLLCAANQIGKSTAQIIKTIKWATSPDLWPSLWPSVFSQRPDAKPVQWYLYPNKTTIAQEFYDKWEPFYLPNSKFKNHPVYGWTVHKRDKVPELIAFNNGYKIYFKTYNQDVHDLQSGSVFYIACDEELPEHLISELKARLFATDGYFSMVFTATIGQEYWRETMELKGVGERYPDAFKMTISLYDCLYYFDMTPSVWTKDRIQNVVNSCKSKAEVQRRVKGRFVKEEGRRFQAFDRERNYKPYPIGNNGLPFKGVPNGWSVYAGVDYGSGGENGHPSAYTFLSVSPDYSKIRCFRCRRLDGVETTAGDLLLEYRKDRSDLNITRQVYDHAAKDFGTIAERIGENFDKADKGRDAGEIALNAALKSGMLVIYQDDEQEKLCRELETVMVDTHKRSTIRDDLIDSMRYALMAIPIDWEKILIPAQQESTPKENSRFEKERPREKLLHDLYERNAKEEIEAEILYWDELYGC